MSSPLLVILDPSGRDTHGLLAREALRQAAQAAEIERLRAALADAQQGRTAAEQQAAVLAARLEAGSPRFQCNK